MSKLHCSCLLFLGICSIVHAATSDATEQKGLFSPCIDVLSCAENEMCVKDIEKSGMGRCECTAGYRRNLAGICSKFQSMKKQLFVEILNKEVRLPENAASLTATAVPSDDHYTYKWTLLNQPIAKPVTITGETQSTVKLSGLSADLYELKVTVSGPNSYGEAYGKVTVLLAKRASQVPDTGAA